MSPAPSPIDRFYSIIPAGGVGSRLWPLSRAAAPKFLHDLSGSGESLLRDTWQRLAALSSAQRIVVVTGEAHAMVVREQLPELEDSNLILESEQRDSSAAIGLAAAVLARREPGVIIGSFHADHVVRGSAAFGQAVRQAVSVADKGYIVTIGITPTEPATGFGYIHTTEELNVGTRGTVLKADAFVEKPSLQLANDYVRSGDYLWNAGMFVARADLLLEQMRSSEPELVAGIDEIADAWDTPDRDRVRAAVWPRLTKIAIDYSVAEPAAADGMLAVIPGHFSWHDVGDFATISQLNSAVGRKQIVVLGGSDRVRGLESNGLVISETDRVIGVIGMENIVIVDTPDALLVTTSEHAQEVKALVEELGHSGLGSVL